MMSSVKGKERETPRYDKVFDLTRESRSSSSLGDSRQLTPCPRCSAREARLDEGLVRPA